MESFDGEGTEHPVQPGVPSGPWTGRVKFRDGPDGYAYHPGRVTVWGQSAGGGSVLALLASPLARDLFERAIVGSGGGRPGEAAAMARLIYSGLFDEMPGLKIVTHHMGGMIPYFAGKVKLGFRQIFFGRTDSNPVAEEAGLRKRRAHRGFTPVCPEE